MRVIDIHVHAGETATVSDVTTCLDRAGVASAVLFSANPTGKGEAAGRYIEALARLRDALGERVHPFAFLDPTFGKSPEILEWGARKCGMVGMKLLPSNFHPRDACARVLYSLAGELDIPVLIHTGILWSPGDNGDNCRPAHMEVMWEYPRTRFAMAHIGWPWTDECIAVAQKLRVMRAGLDQAFVDLTPGTPPSYRESALARCIENVGVSHMLYGSDAGIPSGNVPEGRWMRDKEIFDRLGVSQADQEKIFAGNALRFLGIE